MAVRTEFDMATDWLRDHWDDSPMRIHMAGVDDGSGWGAPPFTRSMELWLDEHACAKVEREIQQACTHRGGVARGCEDCMGSGVKTMLVMRYRWPMRAALWLLRKRVHMPPGWVHYADAVFRYRVLDYDIQATSAALGMTTEKGAQYLVDAIRQLRGKYSEGPIGRPSGISESQSIAMAAA